MNTRLLASLTGATLLWFFPALSFADAIGDLQRFYRETRALQTEFRQLQLDETGTVMKSQEGRFWMQRPEKLRWVYERPYRQVMVNDGKQFWLYDEDLAQVTVRPTSEALQNAPLMLLSGGPELEQQFAMTNLAPRDGLQWVSIKPRAQESDFVEARMALQNGLPHILELQDSLDQSTRILFINLRTNIAIDEKKFVFPIPEGVEVVGTPDAG